MRAFARPRLRPYLPDLRFLRRILGGLMVLLRAGWRAGRKALRRATTPEKKPQAKGEKPEKEKRASFGDAADRLGAGLLICGIAGGLAVGGVRAVWPHVAPYGPMLACVGTVGLLGAAWAVGPDAPPGEKAAAEKRPAAGGAPITPPSPAPKMGPLTAVEVEAAVRAVAVPNGWLGAHLDDVLAHLPGRSRGELLAVLAGARIPVVEQLKLRLPGGRQRNRQGVRLAALPEAHAGAPERAISAPAMRVPDHTPPADQAPVYDPLTHR